MDFYSVFYTSDQLHKKDQTHSSYDFIVTIWKAVMLFMQFNT